MKFGTGVHIFCWEVGVFSRSCPYLVSCNNMSLTVPKAEWLERHAGKQGIAGSIPGRGIYFYFESFADF